jgi:myo-inositol-1(or 4)-monophosphatase
MMAGSLNDDLALVSAAAVDAGAIAMRYFGRSPDVRLKGDTSPVTVADLAVDAHLHDTLRAARPVYGWLSEERPDDGSRLAAERCFIVDPIDGTRAFVAETADWCVSIGIVEAGRPVAGVLFCPATGVLYAASAGGGARRDGRSLAMTAKTEGVLNIAGPGLIVRDLTTALGRAVHRVPPVASLALRLAHVADGTLDATVVKPNSAFWDIAAADLILEEAGGALARHDGLPVDYAAPSVKLGAMSASIIALRADLGAALRLLAVNQAASHLA